MLKKTANRLLLLWRAQRLKFFGVDLVLPAHLGAAIDCRRGFTAEGKGAIRIAEGARIENGVVLHAYGGSIAIERNVFVGPYTVVYGHGGVLVGESCLIGMHCRIVSSNHTVAPIDREIRSEPDVLLPARIGRDVWLGAGVTVLGGVTIGDGCVVGAGAVVTRSLPAYTVAVGNPARVLRKRPSV